MSESVGHSTANGTTRQRGASHGTSESFSESHGTSDTYARSHASTTSRSRSHGTSRQEGEAEAFEAIYASLPASFHSIENERYRAGELLRALPIGRAFVNFNNTTVCIQIPTPKRQS